MKDEALNNVYGSLYEGIKLQRKQGISFNIVFTVRRIVFAAILVFVSIYPWL